MRSLTLICLAAMLAVPAWCQEGPVTLGGITYDRVDPGEPFTQARLTVQDWTAPGPVAAESAAGMIPFVISEPGQYRPDRAPKAEERVEGLSAFLAPDEYEPVWVGVWALDDIKDLTCSVDSAASPFAVDIRHAHFWPQRTGWRSRQWYMTPELLLPCAGGMRTVPDRDGVLKEEAFDVAASSCAVLWLDLHAPANAPAGVHRLSVRIQAAGKEPLVLPLEVEVLPIALRKPEDKFWLLYADTARWRGMSDEQVMDELRDFQRHGVTGLVERPLGTVDLSGIKEGKVGFDASAYRKLAAQCEEAGLPGPHVCSYGGMAPRIKQELGIQCDLDKDVWPEEIRKGVESVARAACEATADVAAKWYFYGVDEPGGDNTYAIQEYEAWHAGGANTYATFYRIDFLEKASAYLDAPCFVTGLVSGEESARRAREACQETGAEFWWYGTGCYVNPFPQEGYLFHNRYGAGFFFWKTGAKASVAWTFCRPHEDVFNDFDGSRANAAEPKEQATTYPHLLKPNDWSTYQGAIPTLAWDGMREGVDDYRYLYTLQTTIARALESPDARIRAQAREAQESVDALVEAVPWANPMGGVAFDTHRMHQVRRAVAEMILGLENAMAGRQAKADAGESEATLTLSVVRPARSVSASTPVVLPAPCSSVPVVDGDLGDDCWKSAASVSDCRDASSGRRVSLDTRAWIAYDDERLYVAFDCPEPAMDSLVAAQTGHDTPMVWVDDGVEFFVAGAARTPYAHVILNTNNSLYDELGQDPGWNPDARTAVSKRADGWSAEISLPWKDLAAGGISRSDALALNFCRNRFARGSSAAHSAWSPTFSGYHVPERFGTALLQEPPVALSDVDLPDLFGRGVARVGLRNLTGQTVAAFAQIEGQARREVKLGPKEAARVSVPMQSTTEGTRPVVVSWGVGEKAARSVTLPLVTPPAMSVEPVSNLVSPGQDVPLPVSLNVSAVDRGSYAVSIQVQDAAGTRTHTLPSRPGSMMQVKLRLAQRATVTAQLEDASGNVIARSPAQVFIPVPR